MFLALFLLAGLGKTFAGYLQFINLTGCSFDFYGGYGTISDPSTTPPTIYGFNFGPMTLGPGTTMYTNPTMIPGFAGGGPASLWATGCAEVIKVIGPGSVTFPIGKTAPITTFTSSNNPPCYTGPSGNYTMNWNTGSNNCDAVILIF